MYYIVYLVIHTYSHNKTGDKPVDAVTVLSFIHVHSCAVTIAGGMNWSTNRAVSLPHLMVASMNAMMKPVRGLVCGWDRTAVNRRNRLTAKKVSLLNHEEINC